MVEIKIIKDGIETHKKGDVINYSKKSAEELVKQGFAEYVDKPSPKRSPAKKLKKPHKKSVKTINKLPQKTTKKLKLPKLEQIKWAVRARVVDLGWLEFDRVFKDVLEENPSWERDNTIIGKMTTLIKNMILKHTPKPLGEEKSDEEPQKQIKETSFYESDGRVYEQIYNPGDDNPVSFIGWDGNNAELFPSIEDGNTIIYPIYDTAVIEGAVLLPSGVEEYLDIKTLMKEVHEFIVNYVDVDEQWLKFAVYYILLSWIHDKLNTIPYLRALGDTGTGKSRVLRVVGSLCYKPTMIGGAVTAAPIFRMQSRWRGTLILEEADRKRSDTTDDVIKILNCGFERGNPVLRCATDNPDDIQAHDPFGPKILGTRQTFYDKALEARCMTTIMQETRREDIPPLLPPSFYKKAMSLRNKLLMFRFRTREKISNDLLENIGNLGLTGIEPRLKQTAAPFFVLFGDEEIKQEFRKFVMDYSKQLVNERSNTLEGEIVQNIYDFIESEIENFSAIDITKKINEKRGEKSKVSTRSIGMRLKSLGLKTKNKRVDDGVRKIVQMDDLVVLFRLFKRYVPEFVALVATVADVAEPLTTPSPTPPSPIHLIITSVLDSPGTGVVVREEKKYRYSIATSATTQHPLQKFAVDGENHPDRFFLGLFEQETGFEDAKEKVLEKHGPEGILRFEAWYEGALVNGEIMEVRPGVSVKNR